MSRDATRRIAPLLFVLLMAGAEKGRAQVVIDAHRHHLGTAGRPEWREFAGSEPEGRTLEVRFEGRANIGEATLLIRQGDVKLGWDVRLNDRRIGQLHPMEALLVHALAVPAGTLRDGGNHLTIGPPPEADDVIIEGVAIDSRPVREALGRAKLEVLVTEPGRDAGLPCRITIVDDRGALAPLVVAPESRLAARPGVVYTPDGHALIGLPPGRYTVSATRGFEYGLDSRVVDLADGQQRRADLAIRREVPTEGLIACDTHVHTLIHSGHGDATLDERAVTLAGEGIELPIATDHDHLTTDLAVAADRMGVSACFTPVVGDEVTTKTGHFNAFPFPAGTKPPDPGTSGWPDLLRAIRSAPGERVVVLNHPRDLHAGFRPFAPEHFNPVTGEHRRGPLGVDALEVINSGAMQSDPMQPVRDWMALRNRGERMTAVGASDSHDVARYIVGQGRTYIACRDDDPARLDVGAACRALKAGRALVSLGLLARMSVDDHFGVGDLATKLGEQVRVAVDVYGPSWANADRVELFANGVQVREARIDPTSNALKARVAWTLPRPHHDVSLVTIASGPGVTAPQWAIARPYQPTSREWTSRVFAITNPIDLDGDGDGAWTSPRAYAEATVARVGLEPAELLPALAAYDEAIAAQAAGLYRAAGRDVRDPEFVRLLAAAPGPVRLGFAAFATTLPEVPKEPARGDDDERRGSARIAPAVGSAPPAVASQATPIRAAAGDLEPVAVEGQPLAANADRVIRTLESLGSSLPADDGTRLSKAIRERDAAAIQRLMDRHVLLVVGINPEERVKVSRGPATAVLQQGGYTPVLIKVLNEPRATRPLRITSPQSGPIVAGAADLSMARQDQRHLKQGEAPGGDPGRFLQVEMFTSPPMTEGLGGLGVEYALALIYSAEAGKREAMIGFEIGRATKDLASRGEVPVLFDVKPAIPVRLRILDHDGTPTAGHFTFLDRSGRVHPPQPKRVAPDLFFQRQVYRHDGGMVLLPPGRMTMTYGRGPEYRLVSREIDVPARGEPTVEARLERWFDPASFGFYGGDHHIHAAGCAHYTAPTEGLRPEDVFLQVKGEGLNVGCILTWGPCYDYQRAFFGPHAHERSEPRTVIKYDVEVSGFGSQALGHVCLLNLRDQTYPGSDGTATKGWPTWTSPVLRWAKAQGAVTGYAHSASGLEIAPKAAAGRLMAGHDKDEDGSLTLAEAAEALLPGDFAVIDADGDGVLTRAELEVGHDRAAEMLPNYAIPEMDGVGAMEIPVAVAEGLCDFISAMDTPRIAECNMWYHLLNCGFPLKVSGETDFPCMSGTRVGQGRVYVRLGDVPAIDFGAWCEGLRLGRSYVSDGFAHAPEFTVGGKSPGHRMELDRPATVPVRAKVAFASRTPRSVAQGGVVPAGGRRLVGDTVNLHGPRREGELMPAGEMRRVELVVNGRAVATREVPADDGVHELEFSIPIERSSWVALRQFPQLHTNPVDVRVGGHPVRASRRSALWCVGAIEQLWNKRGRHIAPAEREEAARAFDRASATYRKIASEAPDGS